jgi:hypothetical protein
MGYFLIIKSNCLIFGNDHVIALGVSPIVSFLAPGLKELIIEMWPILSIIQFIVPFLDNARDRPTKIFRFHIRALPNHCLSW